MREKFKWSYSSIAELDNWNLLIDMIYRRRIKRLPNSAMNWQVQRVAEAIEININLNKN